jgi:hypothetical protein
MAIDNSIRSLRFGYNIYRDNFAFMFASSMIYFGIYISCYETNSLDPYPLIGTIVKLILDFIRIIIPFTANNAQIISFVVSICIGAELVKISLIASDPEGKPLVLSDVFNIKMDLIREYPSLITFMAASLFYLQIIRIHLFKPVIPFIIWCLLTLIGFYLAIKFIFYGYFIFDKKVVVGPFEALWLSFWMSFKSTQDAFLCLSILMVLVVIINLIVAAVISVATTAFYLIFFPGGLEADISSKCKLIARIFLMFLIIPIYMIALADIYRSLKSKLNLKHREDKPES